MAYAKQFKLSFLDVGEEDLEAPIVINGKKVTAEQSEQLWEEMEKVFNTIVADAAKVDADEPWKAPNAEALDKRTLADWIDKTSASPLCKSALDTMMTADNGVVHGVAELSRQPGDGEGRRARESTGPNQRSTAAGAATSSWPRKLVGGIGAPRVLTTHAGARDRRHRQGARVTLGRARCSKPSTCC